MPRLDAIDLSHWNTVDSFAQVFDAGVIGVIHKASEGTSYVDPDYQARMQTALDEHLAWGAYHFLKHGKAEQQMAHFLKVAGLPAGSRVAVDYEDAACTLDDLDAAVAALGELDPSMQIAIYSGHLLKEQVGSNKVSWLERHALWLAQYTTGKPSWPKQIWKTYSLWQFTDKGSCPGIVGDCDLNTFAGDREACAKWFGPVEEAPVLPHPKPKGEVAIAIETTRGVTVQIVVNGKLVQ